ncbi:hypothetical protein HSX37_15825|uniref:hypothetical protein n=1 Tax=Dendrosporobacter quercicolus TaxID=146817 RepID=UPI001113729B|nr:hypothetical protein [Dendrosporobacter quercicolus]NSL49504.1 hypothetical protein [Dendrosporobacter quercicolus DSM 1736]
MVKAGRQRYEFGEHRVIYTLSISRQNPFAANAKIFSAYIPALAVFSNSHLRGTKLIYKKPGV